MAVFSVAIYVLAMRVRLPDKEVHEYVAELATEAEEEETELEGATS